jgi:hypothetical protein
MNCIQMSSSQSMMKYYFKETRATNYLSINMRNKRVLKIVMKKKRPNMK